MVFSLSYYNIGLAKAYGEKNPLTAVSETRVIRVTSIPDESRRCESGEEAAEEERTIARHVDKCGITVFQGELRGGEK